MSHRAAAIHRQLDEAMDEAIARDDNRRLTPPHRRLLATCTRCGELVEPPTPLCSLCMWVRAAVAVSGWLAA
jgi:uncharacterized OB-fold protein